MKTSFPLTLFFALLIAILEVSGQCPTAVITGPKVLCSQATAKLSAASSLPGSGAITSYEWLFNGSRLKSGPTDSTIQIGSPGNYTLRITNASNCTVSSSEYLVENPLQNKMIVSGSHSYCSSGRSILNGISSTITDARGNFQWKLNGDDIPGAIQPFLNITSDGVYRLTYKDSYGCVAVSDTFKVVKKPAPSVTVTVASPLCYNGTAILHSQVSSASPIKQYIWRWNGEILRDEKGATASARQEGTYSLLVTNVDMCDAVSQPVTLSAVFPEAMNIGGPSFICPGSQGTVSLIENPSPQSSYQWQLNGADIPGATGASWTTQVAGTYTLNSTRSGGCKSSSSNSVVMQNAVIPAISIAGNTNYCVGTPNPLTIKMAQPTSYAIAEATWKLDGNEVGNDLIQSGDAAGTYSVSVLFDAGCPSSASSFTVTEATGPTALISGSDSFCEGGNSVLKAIGSTAGTGNITSYRWYRDGILLDTAGLPSYTASVPGDYAVEVVSSTGCKAMSSIFKVSKKNC